MNNEFFACEFLSCSAYTNKLVDCKNIRVAPYKKYKAFPTIAEWQKNVGMGSAITITLKNYIIASLNLQLTNPSLRIRKSDDTLPAEEEIKNALLKSLLLISIKITMQVVQNT